MSDTIELDFGDVKEFAPRAQGVKKGNYLLRVEKIEAKPSKAGNPMWVVDSSFVEGPHQGQQIREFLALTEKALFKVFSWLQAVEGKQLPKKKIKLPNDTATLNKKFAGKVYGAHIDDGDAYTTDKGEEVIPSEIKYHLFAREVQEQAKAASAAPPKVEPDASLEEPADDDEDAEESTGGDVAAQLESFDLDDL